MDKEPAQKIIAALQNRCGFEIEEVDKLDIIYEIAAIIDEHIEFNYR